MWKNSMHPSSPSLRRIKLQLIAADAEGGPCLRRENSHTSTRNDRVHLANFPRLLGCSIGAEFRLHGSCQSSIQILPLRLDSV